MREWSDREISVPLRIIACEYRDLIEPVIKYLSRIEIGPRDVVQVFIPEYVTCHWWEAVLHNQSALRLKSRLLYMPGVMVTSVPYQLKSAEQYSLEPAGSAAYGHEARPATTVPADGAVAKPSQGESEPPTVATTEDLALSRR